MLLIFLLGGKRGGIKLKLREVTINANSQSGEESIVKIHIDYAGCTDKTVVQIMQCFVNAARKISLESKLTCVIDNEEVYSNTGGADIAEQ